MATSAATPADAVPPPRRQDIELLRVISAFGIVWFHVQAVGGAVAYAGLMVFLSLSVWLAGQSRVGVQVAARRRVPRLLLPWLVWCAVYGAQNLWFDQPVLALQHGWLAGVLAGPSIHLWYLPFIFGVLWLLDLLRQHVAPALLAGIAGAVTLALVASAAWWRPVSLGWPYPYLQWCDALAPVAFGLFLAGAPALPRALRWLLPSAILLAAGLLAPHNAVAVSYGLGFAACAVLASGRLQRLPLMPWPAVSEAMFGVYLLHIAIFGLLLRNTSLSPEAMAVCVFGTSWLVVMAFRRLLPRLARYVC